MDSVSTLSNASGPVGTGAPDPIEAPPPPPPAQAPDAGDAQTPPSGLAPEAEAAAASLDAAAARYQHEQQGAEGVRFASNQFAPNDVGGTCGIDPVVSNHPVMQSVVETNLVIADNLMKAGQYDSAKHILNMLKKCPFSDVQLDPMAAAARGKGGDVHPDGLVLQTGGNTTLIKGTSRNGEFLGSAFQTNGAALADQKLQQVEQAERMHQVMGGPVDPHDIGKVKDYFQKFSEGKSTDQVRQEYETYLTNHYQHPGAVNFAGAADGRLGKIDELIKNQPSDANGRKLTDCEGYAYLTKAILGGIKEKGTDKPRFDVTFGGNGSHVVAGVFDRGKTKGADGSFAVNNNKTAPFSSEDKAALEKLKGKFPLGESDRKFLMKRVPQNPNGRTDAERGYMTHTGPKPSDTGYQDREIRR